MWFPEVTERWIRLNLHYSEKSGETEKTWAQSDPKQRRGDGKGATLVDNPAQTGSVWISWWIKEKSQHEAVFEYEPIRKLLRSGSISSAVTLLAADVALFYIFFADTVRWDPSSMTLSSDNFISKTILFSFPWAFGLSLLVCSLFGSRNTPRGLLGRFSRKHKRISFQVKRFLNVSRSRRRLSTLPGSLWNSAPHHETEHLTKNKPKLDQ